MNRPLYHWAPTSRRSSINRLGLVPGKLSTDRLWRPSYVCLADSPSLAWALSGATARGREHGSWDLWMVWLDRLEEWVTVGYDDGSDKVKEYRTSRRVYKRDVWYVGTRQTP